MEKIAQKVIERRHIPPTNDPKDCICGGATGEEGFRFSIACPCCDGQLIEIVQKLPTDSHSKVSG